MDSCWWFLGVASRWQMWCVWAEATHGYQGPSPEPCSLVSHPMSPGVWDSDSTATLGRVSLTQVSACLMLEQSCDSGVVALCLQPPIVPMEAVLGSPGQRESCHVPAASETGLYQTDSMFVSGACHFLLGP